MFSKSDFQHWAKGNVVPFAAVATRIEGRKEDDLLRTYGFRGNRDEYSTTHPHQACVRSRARSVAVCKHSANAERRRADLSKIPTQSGSGMNS